MLTCTVSHINYQQFPIYILKNNFIPLSRPALPTKQKNLKYIVHIEVKSRIVPRVRIHRQKLVEKINSFEAADLGQMGKRNQTL